MKPERCILTSIVIFIAIILIFTNYSPPDDDEYDVAVTVLYTNPALVENTTVTLDGKLILAFTNESVETFPPWVGDITVTLDKGTHNLTVTDANFGHTETKEFKVDRELYIDVIIGEDGIDIDVNEEQTVYK